MGGKSCLRPVVQSAFRSDRNELLRAVANEADDLRARFGVEAAACKDLRDLFAKLAIALKSFFDVLANRLA